MKVKESLKSVLKQIRLSGVLATLPERVSYAQKSKLTYPDFLELLLQDEVERRESKKLSLRLARAGFEEEATLEDFNWETPVEFDRDKVRELFGLGFIERHEDVLLLGPVGVGKTFLATALGFSACRAGHSVLSLRASQLFKELRASLADKSQERVIRRLVSPDLLVIDDFGLQRLDETQSSDFYELVLERHRRSSTLVTSNRAIEEWIPLFHDPLLAQSALDRLVNNSHQLVMEGESYRVKQRPGSDAPSMALPRKRKRRKI